MKQLAVIGLDTGDEGKGRIVDYLVNKELESKENTKVTVIRYHGGNNAGHTVIVKDKKYVLHSIPTGILHKGVDCLIGQGCVVNLEELAKELEDLGLYPLDVPNLFISPRAHLIMPWHIAEDQHRESIRGDDKIGTTLKGIGPAYADKAARIGIQAKDILNPNFDEIIKKFDNKFDCGFGLDTNMTAGELVSMIVKWRELFSHMIDDSPYFGYPNQTVILEGQLGIMKDLNFGEYPYVTSSSTMDFTSGSGMYLNPHVIGVMKAYRTSVGAGSMPTELFGEEGERLRRLGNEYGATTGRPRRVGWLDIPSLIYAVKVSGVREAVMTKLDVLDNYEEIKVCVNRWEGYVTYETLPGWNCSISGMKHVSELPANALHYINYVEGLIRVIFPDFKFHLLSVGPERDQIIKI